MIPLEVRIHGTFIDQITARIAEFIKQDEISVRLRVPPELSWWYWQEYGTAVRGEKGFASGTYYDIDPVSADVLVFPHEGMVVHAQTVEDHPGIKPKKIVRLELKQTMKDAKSVVHKALVNNGANTMAIEEAMVTAVEMAKNNIVRRMSFMLPGVREDLPGVPPGRLGGDQASEVFRKNAVVEKV